MEKIDDISEEDANNNFKLDITMDDAMKQKCIDELLDLKKMKDILRISGNLSPSGLE
jgi:hypothetical protein